MNKIIIEVGTDIPIQKGVETKKIRKLFSSFNLEVKKIKWVEEYDVEKGEKE